MSHRLGDFLLGWEILFQDNFFLDDRLPSSMCFQLILRTQETNNYLEKYVIQVKGSSNKK